MTGADRVTPLRKAQYRPKWVPCSRCSTPVDVSNGYPPTDPKHLLCFHCTVHAISGHMVGERP